MPIIRCAGRSEGVDPLACYSRKTERQCRAAEIKEEFISALWKYLPEESPPKDCAAEDFRLVVDQEDAIRVLRRKYSAPHSKLTNLSVHSLWNTAVQDALPVIRVLKYPMLRSDTAVDAATLVQLVREYGPLLVKNEQLEEILGDDENRSFYARCGFNRRTLFRAGIVARVDKVIEECSLLSHDVESAKRRLKGMDRSYKPVPDNRRLPRWNDIRQVCWSWMNTVRKDHPELCVISQIEVATGCRDTSVSTLLNILDLEKLLCKGRKGYRKTEVWDKGMTLLHRHREGIERYISRKKKEGEGSRHYEVWERALSFYYAELKAWRRIAAPREREPRKPKPSEE